MEHLLHAVLSAESVNFAELLVIAQLDPATDLRGCDFQGVDFGSLTSNNIDLSHCNLTDANLSKVRGDLNLQGAIIFGAKLPSEYSYVGSISRTAIKVKFSLLKQLLISAHRFYLPSRVQSDIVRQIEQKMPVLTCYRSHTEHQLIEEAIRGALIAAMDEKISYLFDRRTNHASIKIIEISSKSLSSRLPVSGVPSLDAAFFKSLKDCKVENLFDKRVEVGFMARIIDNFRVSKWRSSEDYDELKMFANNIDGISTGRSRFANLLHDQSAHGLNIFLMNGISPFSTKTYKVIEKSIPNSRFIWILPSNILYGDIPNLISNNIIPKSSVVYPNETLRIEDVEKFIKRFDSYQRYGLILTEETKSEIVRHVNKPVSVLKNMFIGKIMEVAQSRGDENGSVIL